MAGLEQWTFLAPATGAGMLAGAGFLYTYVRSHPAGSVAMVEAASAVRAGGKALLVEAAKILLAAASIVFALLAWQVSPAAALAFAFGALFGAACCASSFVAGSTTSARTAQAAREAGAREALTLALTGAAVSGLGVSGLTVVAMGTIWVAALVPSAPNLFAGFALGASLAALLSRAAGGIYERAADVALELLSRVQGDLPQSGPGNPASTARSVGELTGVAAGVPAEIFESCVGAAGAAAILAASQGGATPVDRLSQMAYPVAVLAAGGVAAALGAAAAWALRKLQRPGAVRLAAVVPPVVFLGALLALGKGYGVSPGALGALFLGLVGALAVGVAVRGYASRRGVGRIAGTSQLGPAQNVLSGLALGLEATAAPVLVIGASIAFAGLAAGPYGIALAAVGASCAAGFAAAASVAEPTAAQASWIVEAAALGEDTRETARAVEADAERASALGSGLGAAAAAFTSLAWVGAYAAIAGRPGIDLGQPKVLIGLLLGSAAPFFACASTLTAVGDLALEIVGTVRRGLREAARTAAEAAPAAAPAVSAAPRKVVVPGLLGLAGPAAVGFGLGAEALGGFVVGATGAGLLLAFFFLNAGDAWRGTRRQIEGGAMGGLGSEAHRASVVGDTLGEPLKDAAAPAIFILLKLLGAASVLLAPLLP